MAAIACGCAVLGSPHLPDETACGHPVAAYTLPPAGNLLRIVANSVAWIPTKTAVSLPSSDA